jgi:hypothetical protein
MVRPVRHIESTSVIPARRCVSFGFEYLILGTPSGADIPIKMITRFPEQGLRNPETGKTTDRNETRVGRRVGQRHFRAYTLEQSWEVVLGTWTFELWYGDRKLAEQSFKLVDPCPEGCQEPVMPDESACERSLISIAPAPNPRCAALDRGETLMRGSQSPRV